MAMPTERYEILILGSGFGGKLLAWDMAGAGHRTAVVERRWIGGSCPNINCLPSKNEIWSAKVADLVHHAADFGLVTGPYKTDMRRVLERKRDMVEAEVAAHLENYKASGAELIMGTGRFVAPKTVEVRLNDGGTRLVAGDRVFLNLGTHATIPAIPGLSDSRPLTNIELLELERVPEHLVVLGGGEVGLETAGVELDTRGYVKVNDRLETTAPEVWAIGECTGSPQFTHVSVDDFRIIRANLAGGSRSTRDRLIPFCLFTDPPLARVGMTEREARERKIAVRVAKLPMSAVLRTHTTGETAGFMKVLVEASGDHILGFTMIGTEAGEVVAAVQTAMLGGLPYMVLRDAILAHPTMAEGLNGLFAAIPAAR